MLCQFHSTLSSEGYDLLILHVPGAAANKVNTLELEESPSRATLAQQSQYVVLSGLNPC